MSNPGFNSLTPVLCVTNLAASLEHYVKVLGFQNPWKWSEALRFDEAEHPTFACVVRGECGLFLCEKGQGTPGSWICLNLPSHGDLDAVFEEYKASGADIVHGPEDRSWGMREMLVRDRDGNTFRIGTPIPEED